MTRRGVHADTHELRTLEFDLSEAPARIRNPEALMRAGRIVEREMRVDAKGHTGSYMTPTKRHKAPTNLAMHVSSELVNPTTVEVGIENRGAGKLGHIIAYGTPGHGRIGKSPATPGNAPAYDPGAGPRRAMPRVTNVLADHAEESVLGKDKS